jgi:hypothetical protein
MISAVVFRPLEWSQFHHPTAVPSLPQAKNGSRDATLGPTAGDYFRLGKRYAYHHAAGATNCEIVQLTAAGTWLWAAYRIRLQFSATLLQTNSSFPTRETHEVSC